MKYRRLGRTNLRVSVVGVGTWQFGGEWGKAFDQPEVDAMFRRAKALGINLIDTAECYGDHTSEAFIGNAIRSDRASWVVATKFGHKFHRPFERTDHRSAADVRPQVEASLRALRTDYVDLLQYHSVRDEEFEDEAVKAEVERLVREGKVRFVGNSVSKNNNTRQVDECDRFNCAVLQVIYNRLDRTPEQQVLPSCARQDMGVLARVPLASGMLSGKYKPGVTFPEGDVRGKWADPNRDAKLREVEQIRRTEVPPGTDMATWALAWCLQHPAVTSVIPGCKSVAQVESNARAADLDIVRDDHPQAWRG